MKRVLAGLIFSGVALVLILIALGILRKVSEASENTEKIFNLPSFSLTDTDGELFSSSEIKSGPLLIVYFHPDCEHCQFEIASLLGANTMIEDMKLLLVSYADREQIKLFLDLIEIRNEARTWILSDTALVFSQLFGSRVIPSNYIYDKDLKLVKSIKGETRTETILKYLKSEN
jgi:peroxiredoxin